MIHFSNHAIDRYRERVKPAMKRNHVKRELIHLATLAEMTEEAPSWLGRKRRPVDGEESPRYIEVSDGICFALVKVPDGWLATTCLIRSGHVARFEREPKEKKVDWPTSRKQRAARRRIRRAA